MRIQAFFIFAVLPYLVGCAGKTHYIGNIQVPVHPSDNATTKLSDLEIAFSEAKGNSIPFLAPSWFHQAQDSFQEAKSENERVGDQQIVFNKLEEARIELARANEIAGASRSALTEVIDAREIALRWLGEAEKVNSPELAEIRQQLAVADARFLSLGEKIENGRVNDTSSDKATVIGLYTETSGSAAQAATLVAARKALDTAKFEGAFEHAPQTLIDAEAAIKRAETFAEANPQKFTDIKAMGAEAASYADRSLRITLEAKAIGRGTPEEAALVREREMALLKGEANHKQRELTELASENENLSEENRKLAELQDETDKQDARLSEVRSLFSADEAEILQSQKHLIIRLKNLKFPVGQATLNETQLALMAKVQDALRPFSGSEVIVEGHTDSTGSAEVNAKLSQQRADLVMGYLVSHQAVDEKLISAVGKGEEKPLTSNKTKEGRATNRRIDILATLRPVNDRISASDPESHSAIE